ncbi:MAG: hypothetical protein JKY56_22035 [Kofleriaceae bacterium]|nr:hypothetical protein [Kofleriaceae bacterium]
MTSSIYSIKNERLSIELGCFGIHAAEMVFSYTKQPGSPARPEQDLYRPATSIAKNIKGVVT